MRVDKKVGVRADTGLRFKFFVVEGEGNNTPGRIRTIRLDTNGGGEPWLACEWEVSQGRKVRLRAVRIASDMEIKGAHFLQDAYASDSDERKRDDGWRLFGDHQDRMAKGQNVGAFPEEWLPTKVLALRAKVEAAEIEWTPPPLELEAEASPEPETKPALERETSKPPKTKPKRA